ncbi:MAG: hypothetical protein Q9P01_15310 [Anaerolineae bacterium]|nr:hypothetical protein [Anaerolineae bacterium]MDQ7036144.1 hypothetical protein [Anaerolineae bacterium]
MAKSSEIVYSESLADGFRLVVECTRNDDDISYGWKIEILEADKSIFGVASDGEAYESKIAAEVSGRLYFLMNYAHS